MEGIEWRRLIAKTLSFPLHRGMTCSSGFNSSPYAGGLEGVCSSGHSFNPLENHLKNPKKSLFDRTLGIKILIDHRDAEQYFYQITDFLNLTDFRLVRRRPVVIAAPTTGADNHGRLDHLISHTESTENTEISI